jgi:hypothetical protein
MKVWHVAWRPACCIRACPCCIRACGLNLLVLLYIKAAYTNMPQGDRVMKVVLSTFARRLEALLLHALAPEAP